MKVLKTETSWWEFLIIALCPVFVWLANISSEQHDIYNAKQVREVRMIDAWSYMSGSKSSLTEYWKGYFVDVMSDNKFEYEISGGLYNRFKKDNQPIVMDLNLRPEYFDTTINNEENWWFLAMSFSWVFAGICAFLTICWCHTVYTDFRKAMTKFF